MNSKELRKIKELSEARAKKTEFYKRLIKHTYRRIKGYIDYKQVAVDLATHLMCLEPGFEHRGFSDTAWNAMSHSAWMAYESPVFPVFAITRELAEAFLATDLPPHVCGLNRSQKLETIYRASQISGFQIDGELCFKHLQVCGQR